MAGITEWVSGAETMGYLEPSRVEEELQEREDRNVKV